MGIKAKILLPAIALTVIVAAAILASNIVLFSGFVSEATIGRVAAASKVAVHNLEFLKAEASVASRSIAENQAIINAIAEGDRDALLAQAIQMQDELGIDFCTVTDPQGAVIARSHAPESYGDSVVSQANVRAAIGRRSMTAIEQGSVIKLSVRAGTPVLDDRGAMIGIVSVGSRLDTDKFVDSIKEMLGCEATVFLGDERIATTVWTEEGLRALGTKADAHASEIVLAGSPYEGEADILGRTAFARFEPITGADGKTIGMLYVGHYLDETTKTIREFVKNGLIITLIMLAVFTAVILAAVSRAIRDEHERMQIMLDATPLASRLWDREFQLLDCNEAAVKLFKLKNKQEYIKRYFELAPAYQPDGQNTVEKNKRTVAEAFEKGSCTYEWMYQTPDGTPFPAENTLVRVPYGDGYVVAAYTRDLREQKKMTAGIEQRDSMLQTVNHAIDILLRSEPEEFSATLYQSMGMMARAIHADRMYFHKNYTENGKTYNVKLHEWAENLSAGEAVGSGRRSGFSCDGEALPVKDSLCRGETVHSLVHDLPPVCRECLDVRNAMAVMIIPIFLRNEFWGFAGFENCHSERMFSANEESIMRSGSLLLASALIRNEYMLGLREASAELKTALDEAERANSAKSDFLASISHEMRTPLNAIIGLSEVALDANGLSGDVLSNLEKIYNSGATLLSIINDLLDISKVQAGKFIILENQYDVPSMINDSILQNVLRIGSKPIRFVLDVDDNMPACLCGDELRLKQIINNLLSNAIKYTDAGSVELALSCERDGDTVWLTIRVSDTGVGIKPEHMAKLFVGYTQLGLSVNHRLGGTGLGLAITKNLAEMMGGTVTVRSVYGEGSVFEARIRQRYCGDAVIGPQVADSLRHFQYSANKMRLNAKLIRVRLPYARVLVVDDNATNLDVARGLMKPYGMEIDCVTGGFDAIRAIREEKVKYDAVFMDHMMPGMDGVEAAHHIREIGTEYAAGVPIIALTANAVSGSEEMFLNNGFQAFISKPIDLARLDEVIRRFVRDKEREELIGDPQGFTERRSGKDRRRKLESIEGVDIAAGIARYGDEASFIQILRSYAVNTKPLLETIAEVSRETLTDYAITVHGLKGASRNICAEAVGERAEALEQAVKAGDFDFAALNNRAFIEAAMKLVNSIEAALDKADSALPKPQKGKPDAALLLRLRAACDSYDFTGIDAVMEEIERYEYTADGGLAARLKESIAQMKFAEAAEIAEQLSVLTRESEE